MNKSNKKFVIKEDVQFTKNIKRERNVTLFSM